MEKCKRDKCGILWNLMTSKCVALAKDMNLHGFQCSSGWLSNALKRLGYSAINSHREANALTNEEVEKVMIPWKKELNELIEKKDIQPGTLCNADQTGLFY